jgi:hypothetical protein
MSTPGRYHFQSWARRGIGASVNNPDTGTIPDRASLSVQLSLNVQGGTAPNPVLPPAVTVKLFGPGDIAGIDPRMIVRTEPRQFTVNFEPNYLCGIEFDTPDFPWLFTPASPSADRLHPWVALIVLKSSEFTLPSIAPNPLPVLNVLNAAALHDLSVSWAWGHVQITGDSSLTDTLVSAPGNVISRLLCPRRLDPETSYSAFLVPAYQIGVMAGLGQDVSGTHTSTPAWTSATHAPLTLPFYFRFDFTTSDEGDFESLVRKLTPRVLPATVGERPMDVAHADPGFPSAGDPLQLEGALHSLLSQPSPWTGPDKDAFQGAVQDFINQTSPSTLDPNNPGDDPIVVPPIYGRWAAAIQSVDRTAAGWENELNLDPRNRSAAGMGTQIVQEERTALMASAWQQVDGVNQANQALRQAQLARAASQQIYRQHLVVAHQETLMTLTSPLHSRLLASPTTVRAAIRNSRVPERMLSGAFRKAARQPWRLGVAKPGAPTLLTRVSSGAIAIVPPIAPPGGMVPIEQVSQQLEPPGAAFLLKYRNWILIALIVILALLVILAVLVFTPPVAFAVAVILVAAGGAIWSRIQDAIANATAAEEFQFSGFTPAVVANVPPRSGFQIVPADTTSPNPGSDGSDSAEAAAFRTATGQLFTEYQALPSNPQPLGALDIAGLHTAVLTRIDPVVTVAARMRGLINFSVMFPWAPLDPLEPIMAGPVFPQPMYAPLRDLDPQYLLPGVDQILPDTMGLLQTNSAFIESYMVGLNHEMARQLLWNGYPTDQRSSCFRQFWDVSAYVPMAGDPTDPSKLTELLRDIPPINTWSLPSPLGSHPNRTGLVPDNLVLLVRGELFKRYPNAIVYAGKAMLDPTRTSLILDPSDERYPLFRGTLSPDMTFLGFNLSENDARGGTAASPHGFFFVFQQQPSEPRFGLEPTPDVTPVPHWSELAWTSFGGGANNNGLKPRSLFSTGTAPSQILANSPWRAASLMFKNVLQSNALPDFLTPLVQPQGTAIVNDTHNPEDTNNHWGVNSAQTAYILFRLPWRVLIQAKLMLPNP